MVERWSRRVRGARRRASRCCGHTTHPILRWRCRCRCCMVRLPSILLTSRERTSASSTGRCAPLSQSCCKSWWRDSRVAATGPSRISGHHLRLFKSTGVHLKVGLAIDRVSSFTDLPSLAACSLTPRTGPRSRRSNLLRGFRLLPGARSQPVHPPSGLSCPRTPTNGSSCSPAALRSSTIPPAQPTFKPVLALV